MKGGDALPTNLCTARLKFGARRKVEPPPTGNIRHGRRVFFLEKRLELLENIVSTVGCALMRGEIARATLRADPLSHCQSDARLTARHASLSRACIFDADVF